MTNNVKGNTALKGEVKEVANALKVVKSEILPAKAESKPEPKPEVKEEVKPVQAAEPQKPLSFDQIREKGETLFQLLQKFDEVKEKSDELKSFKISHNNENAKIVISDATGRSFASGNPKAISKFIEFCSEQMAETLSSLETEMRKLA